MNEIPKVGTNCYVVFKNLICTCRRYNIFFESPYEIFEPDRDGIQPDSGGNTVLGAKHQPDMNLTKNCLALCWREGQVSRLCPAEVWPDGTPPRA